MARRFFPILFFIAFAFQSEAQMERTMYQVFEVDSVRTIDLDIADIYDIYSWAGSSVLIETNILLSNGSPEILDFLIKEGRYDVKVDTIDAHSIKISTKVRDRKKIKTPAGECTEIPEAKIFLPDKFIWSDDKKQAWRKEEEK